jgi:NACalpha-BTF3-like transcription factor
MANRFTRWAPTQYVPLPIDYYQSALAYKEQKTQESLDKIDAILAGYGSIEPISKDPQALYEQTNEKLRKDVMEIAKQNLDTPSAQRAVNKIINAPETVDVYDKVLTDALYGAEARKNLQEYLKKNPEVNAAEYLSRFARLDLEKGDPTKFDPNRFKNMPVLSDYYDLNKRIEEGIGRLHADSKAMQTIFNDKSGVEYYVNGKITGLGEQKIRKYVISQLQNDPLAKAQMAKNIQYSGYQMNPYDINEGVNQLGTAYRDALTKSETALGKGLSDLYGNLKPAEIEKKRKDDVKFRDQEAILLDNISGLKAYKNTDPLTNAQDWADNKTLAAMQERDNLLRGFDSFAWQETEEGKKYSPWWIARQTAAMNHKYRVAEYQMKKNDTAQMIADALSFRNSPRMQTPVSESGWNDYISTNVKELPSVILGPNGEFTADAYKKNIADVKGMKDSKATTYKKADLWQGGNTVSPMSEAPPDRDNWTYVETGYNQRTDASRGIYVRKGAKPITNTKEALNTMFEQGKQELQNFVNTHSKGVEYDVNKEEDRKKAIQAVINYKQERESFYMPIVTDPTSTSATRISRIKENLNYSNMYQLGSSGKLEKITKSGDVSEARKKVREHLEKDKGAAVQIMPISPDGRSYDVVNVGDKTYYIEGTPSDQNTFAGANHIVGQMTKPGGPVRRLDDGSLYLDFMGEGGRGLAGVMVGGSDEKVQKTLSNTWDANVKQIMDQAKVSKEVAEKALRSSSPGADGTYKVDVRIGPNEFLRLPLKVHVGRDKAADGNEYFYSFSNINEAPLRGIEDVIRGSIRNSQSTMSQQRMYDILPFLRAGTKESTIMGGGDDFNILDVLSQTDQD